MTAMYVGPPGVRTGLSDPRPSSCWVAQLGEAPDAVASPSAGSFAFAERSLSSATPSSELRQGSTFYSLSRLSRSSRAWVSSFCGQIWSKAAFKAAPMSTAMESR